jgi:hypothetical protein
LKSNLLGSSLTREQVERGTEVTFVFLQTDVGTRSACMCDTVMLCLQVTVRVKSEHGGVRV